MKRPLAGRFLYWGKARNPASIALGPEGPAPDRDGIPGMQAPQRNLALRVH